MSIWFQNDNRLPQTRLAVISYAIVGLMALLLLGFWKLQIVNSDRYAQLAERNSIRTIPIIAPRGSMFDREGRLLVDNYPSFSVLLLRDNAQQVAKLLPQIADGLGLKQEDVQQQLDAAKFLPHFQPIVIKPEASPSDIAFIESHRSDVPVLEMLMVHRRRYPREGFMAHVSGYVGEVSTDQIEQSDMRYKPGDIVGKTGLEKQYNEQLMGVDGTRRVIVNSVGREVGRLEETEATPGKPIKLTIDYDLQAVAEQDLAGKRGAVVVMNPQTGEILAMASQPSYDPNDFAVRISGPEWAALNNDPQHPLMDRAIQAQLAPGSVFKIIMTTAMLESKAIDPNYRVFCPGYATFYGRTFHDAEKDHGEVDLHKAVVKSCDVYFYNVGERLGIDRISYYAAKLGLGRKTGIDLPGEEGGLVPSEEWKERVYHQKWYPGETISVSIGQGATVATPMQLAYTIGGIAMGGKFHQPHLLMSDQPSPEIDFPISESTTDFVTQAMWGVVNEDGTAAASKLPGIEFCGKTGTAQVIGAENKGRAANGTQTKNNAWFVGFAPRRNPEIAVAVLVQAGGFGAVSSAPIARDIVKAYYDKKQGIVPSSLVSQDSPIPVKAPPAARTTPAASGAPVKAGAPSAALAPVKIPTAKNEAVTQEQSAGGASSLPEKSALGSGLSSGVVSSAQKREAMKQGTSFRDYDWWLLTIVFSICGIGLVEIWSATHSSNLAGMQWRQVSWIAMGVVAMLLLSRLDYHAVLDKAPILYLIGLLILVAVLAMGHTRFGAKRWLPVLGQFFQVSELAKLIIIISLAQFFTEVRSDRLELGDLFKAGALTAIPVGLILLQPDLGTAMVLVPVAVVGAYLAGIQWKHAAVLILAGAMMLPVGWHFLKPYQKERVTTFMRPENDPKGSGYQILQSKIAVGSGGFWGKGLGHGSQNQLGFVPVRYSDFILAALAEETGFAGVFLALVLYTALLLRLIQNAQRAKDRAGMFLVMGVAAILSFHVLVNVAMVIGFMPVTGIPLPLMSYGGSATLFVFLALGLVMNVRLRRFVN